MLLFKILIYALYPYSDDYQKDTNSCHICEYMCKTIFSSFLAKNSQGTLTALHTPHTDHALKRLVQIDICVLQ